MSKNEVIDRDTEERKFSEGDYFDNLSKAKKLVFLFYKVPVMNFVVLALTLGLAPFAPPHLYEKLVMLFSGNLVKAIDWFDLIWHGFPWALLAVRVVGKRG